MIETSRASSRREISAWGALDWAYRREYVRAGIQAYERRIAGGGGSSWAAIINAGNNCSRGGILHDALPVHRDALAIDACLRAAFCGDVRQYLQVVKLVESGRQPLPYIDPPLRPHRPMPDAPLKRRLRKGVESFEVPPVYDIHRHQTYCVVKWEGFSAAEIAEREAAQQALYAMIVALLDVMEGWSLETMVVVGRGLTASENHLTRRSTIPVLRAEAA